MRISVELFGAARELSKTKYLEFNFSKSCKIIDIKKKLCEHVDNKFNGNLNYKEIIKSSTFCSDKDQLIKENQILNKNQIIGIIPPIGGG